MPEVSDVEWVARRFQEQRPRLRAVAYRMLGSTSDADDAVQEAWLRLSRSDADQIDNLQAWLTTVVARVALNMLRSRRTRREDPLEARLPDPLLDAADGVAPEHEALLADSVGLALLVVLETLSPAERLAYVLHDMFSLPFDEIGAILQRSPDAARQLASRGRRRLREVDPHADSDGDAGSDPGPEAGPGVPSSRAVVDAFLSASRRGDFEALLEILDPDVVRRSDSGRGVDVVRGAAQVARSAMIGARPDLVSRPALVNGEAGWVAVREGALFAVAAVTVRNGRIAAIDILLDPARLARLDLAILG